MSEQFLYELLQSCNIEKTKGERCSICLEEFDTLSRESGTIEVAISLPCSHIVGSACITTWLKDNSTCPICRREFFPAQPRPFLEHGIMDGQGDDGRDVTEINEEFCRRLDLGVQIAMISGHLVQKLIETRLLGESHGQYCIIAVSIYMASHLADDPRSPREIAGVTDAGADLFDAAHIRETYTDIYSQRERLADVRLRYLMEEVFDETGPLRWPAPGHLVTDDEIEYRHQLQTLEDRCAEACNELELDYVGTELTTRIAAKLFFVDLVGALSPRAMAAASIFMASHIICDPCSTRSIARALDLTAFRVRTAYQTAFAYRDLLAGQPWLETFGRGDTETLLARLPLPVEY